MAAIHDSAPQVGDDFSRAAVNTETHIPASEFQYGFKSSTQKGNVPGVKSENTTPSEIEPLPSHADTPNDPEEVPVEQHGSVDDDPGFEVLGLMRTTSRKSYASPSRRRMSQIEDHISSIPEKDDHDQDMTAYEEPPKRNSITGLGLRSRLKQKLPNIRSGNSDKAEKDHRKVDSANPDSEFEVLGLMKTNTRSEDTSPVETKPSLERHISTIPQNDDNRDTTESGYELPPKLKRHISSIPSHDYDSEGEEPVEGVSKPIEKVEKHDSGTAGSDFEVHGLMRITSNESGRESPRSPMKKPGLERHISKIPQRDDDDDALSNSVLKSPTLEKTISNIPVHDYDSDDENPGVT